MKKGLVLLILIMTICSSAFAEDKPNIDELLKYASECNLNLDRWQVITASKDYSLIRFFDKDTVISINPYEFEVWLCDYITGKAPCIYPTCIEKNIDKKKHYHVERWLYDAKALKMTLLSIITRDEQNQVIGSTDFPIHLRPTSSIPPESISELTLYDVKDFLKSRKND